VSVIERCGDCYYWDRKERECHRNPPSPFPMPSVNPLTGRPEATVLGLHSPTPETGWCGQFAPRASA